MGRLTAIAGAGLTTIALTFALVGCGSNTKEGVPTTAEASAEVETTTAEASPTETPDTRAPQQAGKHRTIQDYIRDNAIQETPIKRGDPGPRIDLPVPDGWQAADDMPNAPYGAIVYQDTAVPDNPPRILALVSKLTGDVDPAEILALASGELNNIPGFDGPLEGDRDSLGGFDAVQLGGSYEVDGKKGMIAQKTVVIPGQDGLYVLQLNAYSSESEAGILGDATNVVDERTTITP
ncbi:hypothetical protein A5727_09880 [Mycobacterium sp. ACS4331]|nr:hypothetical protein A5727_09880 [Mycobacterium sp. ACS4331]